MKEKFIYFLRPIGEQGPIKIGCSIDPKHRLGGVEIWSPVRLELICYAPGSHFHENWLHTSFVDDRLHGEWFSWSPALQNIIDRVLECGVLPPVATPSSREEAREYKRAHPRKMSKRDKNASIAKSKLTNKINNAERHANGYAMLLYVRPDEIAEIMARYDGYSGTLPTEEEISVIDQYVGHLYSLPKADRSWSAWKAWLETRRSGLLPSTPHQSAA